MQLKSINCNLVIAHVQHPNGFPFAQPLTYYIIEGISWLRNSVYIAPPLPHLPLSITH